MSYRTDSDERIDGAVVFARLRSGRWTVVSDGEDGTIVVEDSDGTPIILRREPDSEDSSSGPHVYR